MRRWLGVIAFAAPLALSGAALAQSADVGSADSSASAAAKAAGSASKTDTGRAPSSSGATQGAAGPADTAYGSGGNEAGTPESQRSRGHRHEKKSSPGNDGGVSGARER